MPDISYAAISLESISGDLWYSLYHGALVLCVPFNSSLRLTFGKKKKATFPKHHKLVLYPKRSSPIILDTDSGSSSKLFCGCILKMWAFKFPIRNLTIAFIRSYVPLLTLHMSALMHVLWQCHKLSNSLLFSMPHRLLGHAKSYKH